MMDNASMEALLKEKLAQLELGKPASKEELQKEKADIRAAMHEADAILKAEGMSTVDKIKAIHAYIQKMVRDSLFAVRNRGRDRDPVAQSDPEDEGVHPRPRCTSQRRR